MKFTKLSIHHAEIPDGGSIEVAGLVHTVIKAERHLVKGATEKQDRWIWEVDYAVAETSERGTA